MQMRTGMLSIKRRWSSRLLLVTLSLLLLSGCATMDVDPFADATAELHRAVNASGAVTADALASAAQERGQKQANAKEFVKVWQERVVLMDVLLGYSDALASAASAGAQARENTKALGDSISRLSMYVPVSGAAVDAGVRLGQALVQVGAQIKANDDISEAVKAAHPVLEEVADFLIEDLEDLRRLYVNAILDRRRALNQEYGEREAQYLRLLGLRNESQKQLNTAWDDEVFIKVKKIEELLSYLGPEHQAYVDKLESLKRHRAETTVMFAKTQKGVRAWVQAHEDLELSVDQERRTNLRLLLSTAEEVRDAVRRIEEL